LSGSRRSVGRGATLPRLAGQENHGRSVPSLQNAHSQNDVSVTDREPVVKSALQYMQCPWFLVHARPKVMDEARALRLHKQRLEHRSRILEQQNEQLELQLRRLKKVIEQQKENGPRTQWSAEPDLATERRPNLPLFATPNDEQRGLYDSSSRSRLSERTNWKNDGAVESENRTTRMQSLLATVDDLGRAMENLVVSVVYDSDQEQ
uniref:Dystrobrevin alpha n=1 Tax=Angiostrongylus cantonensis TaxID=6313 RepID=A0A0K0DP91_ANGCA